VVGGASSAAALAVLLSLEPVVRARLRTALAIGRTTLRGARLAPEAS